MVSIRMVSQAAGGDKTVRLLPKEMETLPMQD
jgi:hypothetical protein